MKKASMKNGWTAFSHDLTERLAESDVSPKGILLVLLVGRKTYGCGRRELATIEIAWLAEKLKIEAPSVRRLVRVLLAAKILVEGEPEKRLRAGERYLGIQTADLTSWRWREAYLEERGRDMPLFAAAGAPRREPNGDIGANPEGSSREPTRFVRANPEGSSERQKSSPPATLQNPKKPDEEPFKKTDDARGNAPAATIASGSGSLREASTNGPLLSAELFGAQRFAASTLLGMQLSGGLEAQLGTVAREVERIARAAERDGRARKGARAYAWGMLKNRTRLRELAAKLESQTAEARARADGPPKDDGPRGAPRVASGAPSGACAAAPPVTFGAKLGSRDAREVGRAKLDLGGRCDPLAAIAALGIQLASAGRAA